MGKTSYDIKQMREPTEASLVWDQGYTGGVKKRGQRIELIGKEETICNKKNAVKNAERELTENGGAQGLGKGVS
eukprot:6208041-Pleurochrysis_carterae.AAC.3